MNRGKLRMVFDWDKAARLIREKRPTKAAAGLHSDWEYTGGTIYVGGDPVTDRDKTYTYLASTWAEPELSLDGEVVDCYRMENDVEWDEHTLWPASALEILRG